MSSQPLGLWFAHIAAGKFVTVTPPFRLFVVNACLSYKLPEGERGRATLLFGEYGSDEAVPIASLVKDVGEQASMSLILEAHETYAFATKGPYPVDLIGYYPASGLGALHSGQQPPPDDPTSGGSTSAAVQRATNSKSKQNGLVRLQATGSERKPKRTITWSEVAANTTSSDRVPQSTVKRPVTSAQPAASTSKWAASLFSEA